MDEAGYFRYFPAMPALIPAPIPSWQLYGEDSPFPDLLHIERIVDRAEGLDWRIAPHRHLNLHQVFLILSGEIALTLDGRKLRAVPPVVLNLPRGTVHGFAFSTGTEGFVLTLPAADFPDLFGAQSEAAPGLAQAFMVALPAGMAALFATLAADHAGTAPLRRLRLRAGALALCAALAEGAPVAAAPPGGDARIVAFEGLVRAHLDRRWRLEDYARALAVSDRHLRRLCREATGLSAQAFVEAIRLREACRLLAYTRMQVQEVGFSLGFDDPAYFARAFRRVTGLSPGDYRARLEG
jgi:AraC family transcriptional regulator, transcriptional activator of pobA